MKLPHSLRLMILLLRLAVGVNLFYLGFAALFAPLDGHALKAQSLGGLYAWVTTNAGTYATAFQWTLLIVGACLILGLMTRLVAIFGIMLISFHYFPTLSFSHAQVAQFVGDEVILIVCLLVLIFSNAGKYIGLDRFIHLGMKHEK